MARNMAKLDASGVLLRFETVPDDHVVGADEVEVPENCDLQPNRYRWDGKTFHPLQGPALAQPARFFLAEKALFRLVRALDQQGVQIPAYTREWAEWFKDSIDNQGG